MAAAQDWYESRCHDLLIKGMILFVLVQIAAMYLWVPQGKLLAFRIALGCMLGMPLIMAGSVGFPRANAAGPGPSSEDPSRFSPCGRS